MFSGRQLLALGAVLMSACTATEQTSEKAAPSVPAEVSTDAQRRAIYNSNGTNSAVPDATPNRVRLGNQAADINREKRIENLNSNEPNNLPPEVRIKRLENDPPVNNTPRP